MVYIYTFMKLYKCKKCTPSVLLKHKENNKGNIKEEYNITAALYQAIYDLICVFFRTF